MTFAVSFFTTQLCYFLTMCQNIPGGSSSKGKVARNQVHVESMFMGLFTIQGTEGEKSSGALK